jgi:hypothetical protein
MPSVFDPKRERSNFRVSGPDNVCIALLPRLCRRYTPERYKVNFDFLPWQADAADMLERGSLTSFSTLTTACCPLTSARRTSTARTGSSVRMPYFGAALSCLPGRELVLTLTSGMTQAVNRASDLRLVKAPPELRPFHFLMVWHPRLTTDPRHAWLREAMRHAAHPK